jgi:hypothetical protein
MVDANGKFSLPAQDIEEPSAATATKARDIFAKVESGHFDRRENAFYCLLGMPTMPIATFVLRLSRQISVLARS